MSSYNRSYNQKRELCVYCSKEYYGLESKHQEMCETYQSFAKQPKLLWDITTHTLQNVQFLQPLPQPRGTSGSRAPSASLNSQQKSSLNKNYNYDNYYASKPPTTQQQKPSQVSSSFPRVGANLSTKPVKPLFSDVLQLKKNFQRSQLVREFGTENKNGHLNCFLNVCLQALWQFPRVRTSILYMIDTVNFPGSAEVQPFVISLLDFYKRLFAQDETTFNPKLPVVNSNYVRAELFKLHYDQNEFVLHEKADAFEALDKILRIIHVWQKTYDQRDEAGKKLSLTQGMRLLCDDHQACFIHESFGQSNKTQELCDCGMRGPAVQDQHVFGFSINVKCALETLGKLDGSNQVQKNLSKEQAQVIVTNEKLIDALKVIKQNQRQGCVDNKGLGQKTGHSTQTITCIEKNPEVLIFNATWDGEPIRSQIFKLMVSIPERFQSNQLFDDNQEDTYVLRGLIAYQGAHYLSFFRRLFIKLENLPIDPSNSEKSQIKMKAEISNQTEWTLFDDAVVDHKDSWRDVVQQCIELLTYPTVLFYEKLDPNEIVPENFEENKLSQKQILDMFKMSQISDSDFVDVRGGYSDAILAQQEAMMKEFEKSKKKELNPCPMSIEQEEHKVPPMQVSSSQNQSVKAPTIADLKKKYKEFGIYLFQCNKCDDGIMALHVSHCLRPGCGSENNFMQEMSCSNLGKWRECLKKIFDIKNWSFTIQPFKPEEQKVSNIEVEKLKDSTPVQPVSKPSPNSPCASDLRKEEIPQDEERNENKTADFNAGTTCVTVENVTGLDLTGQGQNDLQDEQSQPMMYWKCCKCDLMNSTANKSACYYCRADTYRDSTSTQQKSSINNALNNSPSKNQQNVQSMTQKSWRCNNCNLKQLFAEARCLGCKISLPQQIAAEEQERQEAIRQKAAMKCVQCKINDKFKHYEHCQVCRINNLTNESQAAKVNERQKELEAQKQKLAEAEAQERQKLADVEAKRKLLAEIVAKKKREAEVEEENQRKAKIEAEKKRIERELLEVQYRRQTEEAERIKNQCQQCKKPRDTNHQYYCSSCLCAVCNKERKEKLSDKCFNCIKEVQKMWEDETRKVEEENQMKMKEKLAKEENQRKQKQQTCPLCQDNKQFEQEFCTVCMFQQRIQKLHQPEQFKKCKQCTQPAIKQLESDELCAYCQKVWQKTLQNNKQRAAQKTCGKCWEKRAYEDSNWCYDCLPKCMKCKTNIVTETGDFYCAPCQEKEKKQLAQPPKFCERCKVQIFNSLSGKLCNTCVTLCLCLRRNQRIVNGYGVCQICINEAQQAKPSPSQSYDQVSMICNQSDSGQKYKKTEQPKALNTKCPKCLKSFVPVEPERCIGDDPKQLLTCQKCCSKSQQRQILQYNGISSAQSLRHELEQQQIKLQKEKAEKQKIQQEQIEKQRKLQDDAEQLRVQEERRRQEEELQKQKKLQEAEQLRIQEERTRQKKLQEELEQLRIQEVCNRYEELKEQRDILEAEQKELERKTQIAVQRQRELQAQEQRLKQQLVPKYPVLADLEPQPLLEPDASTPCKKCKQNKKHQELAVCFKCHIESRENNELGLNSLDVENRNEQGQIRFRARLTFSNLTKAAEQPSSLKQGNQACKKCKQHSRVDGKNTCLQCLLENLQNFDDQFAQN